MANGCGTIRAAGVRGGGSGVSYCYLESSGALLIGTSEIQAARIAPQTFLVVVVVLVQR